MISRATLRWSAAGMALFALGGCSWIRTGDTNPYRTAEESAVVDRSAASLSDVELLRREFLVLESRIAELEYEREHAAPASAGPAELARLGPPAREAHDDDHAASSQHASMSDHAPQHATRPTTIAASPDHHGAAPSIRSETETHHAPTQHAAADEHHEPAQAIPAQSVLRAAHLASYSSTASAQRGWLTLTTQFPNALSGLTPRVERADLGSKGVFYRLKAGPFGDDAAVRAACRPLVASGVYCAPTHYRGDAL